MVAAWRNLRQLSCVLLAGTTCCREMDALELFSAEPTPEECEKELMEGMRDASFELSSGS